MSPTSGTSDTLDELGPPDTETLLEELDAAFGTLEEERQRIGKRGREETESIASLYDDFDTLFDRYQDRATDWDDLEGYAQFREAINDLVDGLPADTPEDVRSAVSSADDQLITGGVAETLSATDFRRARESLAPLRECAERRDAWHTARQRYRQARGAVASRLEDVDDRISELQRVASLGSADLDAPVEDIRDPIQRYGEGIEAAFAEFRETADSRDVLAFLSSASSRPLIEYRSPPDRLQQYLNSAAVGGEPLPTVLEYASYSRSKLQHYVDDPDQFRTVVGSNQTYLERLSGDPLRISWPPPSADRVRYRCQELIPVAGRIAPDEVIAELRTIRDLAETDRFDRLRRSAIARQELDAEQRDRIQSGAIQAELESLRSTRDALQSALNDHPAPDSLEEP